MNHRAKIVSQKTTGSQDEAISSLPVGAIHKEGTDQPVLAADLVTELARSLHVSGSPAYELEHRMEHTAQKLDSPANFFSTPTSLFITFASNRESSRLIRVWPAETNLAKLARLYELQRGLEQGKLTIREAWRKLQEIESMAEDYGALINILAFSVVSMGVSVLMGGNLTVVIAAGVIGLIIGIMMRCFERFEWPFHLVTVIAGFVATVLASLIQFYFPTGNIELTLLAALIVLLPGLQITISINELATQNLASGTARFAGAMTTLLTMVFGVVMGHGFCDKFLTLPPSIAPQSHELIWSMAVLIPVALAFGVLFRARRRDIIWILASTLISFCALKIASLFMDPLAAVGSAALTVGVISNLFTGWRNLPAAIMLMPGLLLLVPGSLGFSGISAIVTREDLPHGIAVITSMLLVAVSIVAGLLLANIIVASEKTGKR